MHVNIKKLKENATIPTKGSRYCAGYDLYSCLLEPVTIQPGETAKIPTGLAVEIPQGLLRCITTAIKALSSTPKSGLLSWLLFRSWKLILLRLTI